MVINAIYLANWHAIKQFDQTSIQQNNVKENKNWTDNDCEVHDSVLILNTGVSNNLILYKGPFKIIQVHAN